MLSFLGFAGFWIAVSVLAGLSYGLVMFPVVWLMFFLIDEDW